MTKTNRWAALVAISLAGWSVAHAEPTAAKKELIQRLLVATQPEIDGMAQQIATQPAAQLGQMSQQFLMANVPVEKREAAAKQIEAALKKYVDESVPVVRDAATKAALPTYLATVDEKFSEDELRQIITFLESPARKKWQQAVPELQNAMVKRVVDDAKAQVDPKLQTAQQSITKILEGASGKSLSNPDSAGGSAAPAAPKKKK